MNIGNNTMNNEKLQQKLQEFLTYFQNAEEMKELQNLTKKILANEELRKKISNLHQMNPYDLEYLPLKKEIMRDKDYQRYLELMGELNRLTLEFSQKMKNITKEEKSNA